MSHTLRSVAGDVTAPPPILLSRWRLRDFKVNFQVRSVSTGFRSLKFLSLSVHSLCPSLSSFPGAADASQYRLQTALS